MVEVIRQPFFILLPSVAIVQLREFPRTEGEDGWFREA
jgi:hypothetical protein